MEYVVLDNGEKLIVWPTPEEALQYVKECELEDIAEGDQDLHKYVIKGQEPRAEAAAKAKKAVKHAGFWAGLSRLVSSISWVLGFAWGAVWFTIKLISSIVAYIILTSLKLVILCIKAVTILIVGIFAYNRLS